MLADVIAKPFMADVIAMCGWCCCHYWLLLYWLMLLPMWWLMFLPYVADGIATLYVMGWCYCPVADGIATWLECGQILFGQMWQMEWATESIILVLVLCCYWEPHPTYKAGGICLCSYSGMDHWLLCTWILYQPGEILFLPTHYLEVVKCGSVTWDVTMVMYGWGGL